MAEARRVHHVPLCLCYSGGRLCLLQGEEEVSNVSEDMPFVFVRMYTFTHMHMETRHPHVIFLSHSLLHLS